MLLTYPARLGRRSGLIHEVWAPWMLVGMTDLAQLPRTSCLRHQMPQQPAMAATYETR